MARYSKTRMVLNVIGWILGVISIFMLFTTTNFYFWLMVLVVGSILIGGLPPINKIKKKLVAAPAAALLSLGLIVFLFKAYGSEDATKIFITTLVGLFVVGLLIVPTFQQLLRNK